MASLNALPAELLAPILEYALAPRDAPACPSEDQDRTRLTGSVGVWIRTQRLENPALPLLLVNRLFNMHVKAITAVNAFKYPLPSYALDVMFVKKAGLWPTWTDVPVLARHIDTVHVTFRIFNPAPDLNSIFNRSGLLGSGLVGSRLGPRLRPHPGVWNFYHLITSFLQGGPQARSAARPREATCQYTIRNLVIDVLSPSEDEDHAVTGPGEVFHLALGRIFSPRDERRLNHETFPRRDPDRDRTSWVMPPPHDHQSFPQQLRHREPEAKPAEKLELFLRGWIRKLLRVPYEPDNSTVLYEGILDSIELRVDGQERWRFDVEDALRVATPRSWLIPWLPTQGERFLLWKEWMVERRRLFRLVHEPPERPVGRTMSADVGGGWVTS